MMTLHMNLLVCLTFHPTDGMALPSASRRGLFVSNISCKTHVDYLNESHAAYFAQQMAREAKCVSAFKGTRRRFTLTGCGAVDIVDDGAGDAAGDAVHGTGEAPDALRHRLRVTRPAASRAYPAEAEPATGTGAARLGPQVQAAFLG